MWDYLFVAIAFLILIGIRFYLTSVAYENKRAYYDNPKEMFREAVQKIKDVGNIQLLQSLNNIEKVS